MTNKSKLLIAIFLLGLFSSKIAQSKTQAELSQSDVIKSADKFYPKILSYYEKVNSAKGTALGSLGFFDITLKQTYKNKTRGFYDGKISDSLLEKELGFLGAKVYGGYRKSSGSFADYDGDQITDNKGEYRAGASFSLLQNSTIDQNRLGVILANLGVKESRIQLETIRKEIRRDATKAYWKWIVAAEVFAVYEDLYNLSIKRQAQLEKRLKRGDVAQIIVIENRKNILRRKTAMIKSLQDFENSAIYLSLFWRDEKGKPKVPSKNLAPRMNSALPNVKHHQASQDLTIALSNRPELRILKLQKEQNSSQLKYAKNLLKPKLDIDFEASKDLGNGISANSKSNNSAGLSFSIPLQRREAKGKTAKYESKLKSIKYEKQIIAEKIEAELKRIKNRINSIVQMHENILEESQLAKLLEASEREKFIHGASNFFLVNIREQDTAEATASLSVIYGKYQEAQADYKMAVFLD